MWLDALMYRDKVDTKRYSLRKDNEKDASGKYIRSIYR